MRTHSRIIKAFLLNILGLAASVVIFPFLALSQQVQPLRTFYHPSDIPIYSSALSPDGKMVATTNWGTIIWDTNSGESLMTLKSPMRTTDCVAFSPDGKQIVTGDDWGLVKIWDLSTGEAIREIDFDGPEINAPTSGPIRSVAFSATSKYLGASTASPAAVKVWDLQSGEMVFQGATREPDYLQFLPDERRILLRDTIQNETGANIGYQGELWDIFSKEIELTFEGSLAILTSNGKLVMTYDHDDASPIYRLLWDAETGKQLHVFRYDGRAVAFPAISPDGKMTLMCESRSVTSLIDTQTDKVLREFGNVGQPLSAHQAFSDDGRLMITVYGNTVYLWDISDLAAGVKDEAQVYDKQE